MDLQTKELCICCPDVGFCGPTLESGLLDMLVIQYLVTDSYTAPIKPCCSSHNLIFSERTGYYLFTQITEHLAKFTVNVCQVADLFGLEKT